MDPGFYVNRREFVTRSDDGSRALHIVTDDWLVTDGVLLGRFDKDKLEWVPVQWKQGHPVKLTERLTTQLEMWSRPINFSRLESEFSRLVEMPDSPTPDMPKPPLQGLGTYLRSRDRMLSAGVYDRRLA